MSASDFTHHLGLPYLLSNQAQKHVTLNESLRALDGLLFLSVVSRSVTTPPVSPSEGDRYLIAGGASGDWSGKSGLLSCFVDGGWLYFTPQTGWVCWIEDEALLLVKHDEAWRGVTPDALQNLERLGLGATADGSNPLLARLNAALFTALETGSGGSGDLRFKLNKEASGDVLSLLLQIGYSTRAELGLLNDDQLTLQVSPDGSAFKQALQVGPATGAVALKQHPKFSGYCNYDQYNAAGAWFAVDINNFRHNAQGAVSSGVFTAPHDGVYLFGCGGRLKLNAAPPLDFGLGLSVNSAAPSDDRRVGFTWPETMSAHATGKVTGSSGAAVAQGASVTRDATGRYTVTLATTMPSADYVVLATVTGVAGVYSDIKPVVENQTASSFIINLLAGDNSGAADVAGDADFFFAVFPPAGRERFSPMVTMTSLLQLSAGDTVACVGRFDGNDAYLEADTNYFWGAQIA